MAESQPPEDDLHGHVRAIERELNVPVGFLEKLIEEADDWSFIIKLHALLDAAVTHLITFEIGREALRDTFAAMQMGDGRRNGKLAIAKKLGLLGDDVVSFIVTVGQIRNRFAHSVTAVNQRIEDYVTSRPEGEHETIYRCLAYFAPEGSFALPDGRTVGTVTFARENPRLATWWSAMNVLAIAYIVRSTTAQSRQLTEQIHEHNARMAETVNSLLRSRGILREIGRQAGTGADTQIDTHTDGHQRMQADGTDEIP
jgi:hypothetical protein